MRTGLCTVVAGIALLLPAGASPAVTGAALSVPVFEAEDDMGINSRLRSLAAVAGPRWREIAERNRTTGLERLSYEPLRSALVAVMRKYANPVTHEIGGEPLDELGEIAEAACRGMFCNTYCWALWRDFFSKDAKVDNAVTAAKLINGFERSMAGVRLIDPKGERIDFAPEWQIAPFRAGTYRTVLPDGGHFAASWSNTFYTLHYRIDTSAREVSCHIKAGIEDGFSRLAVDGEETGFTRSMRGCNFTVIPGADGVAEIVLRKWIKWGSGKVKGKK